MHTHVQKCLRSHFWPATHIFKIFRFLSSHWLPISSLYQSLTYAIILPLSQSIFASPLLFFIFVAVMAYFGDTGEKKYQQLSATPLKIYIYRNNSPFSGTLRKKGPFWGSKTSSGDEYSTVPQITNPQVFRPGLGQCWQEVSLGVFWSTSSSLDWYKTGSMSPIPPSQLQGHLKGSFVPACRKLGGWEGAKNTCLV